MRRIRGACVFRLGASLADGFQCRNRLRHDLVIRRAVESGVFADCGKMRIFFRHFSGGQSRRRVRNGESPAQISGGPPRSPQPPAGPAGRTQTPPRPRPFATPSAIPSATLFPAWKQSRQVGKHWVRRGKRLAVRRDLYCPLAAAFAKSGGLAGGEFHWTC